MLSELIAVTLQVTEIFEGLSGQQSDRQWQDIQGILQVSGEQLDRGYLYQTAAGLGVGEILEQAFQDAKS